MLPGGHDAHLSHRVPFVIDSSTAHADDDAREVEEWVLSDARGGGDRAWHAVPQLAASRSCWDGLYVAASGVLRWTVRCAAMDAWPAAPSRWQRLVRLLCVTLATLALGWQMVVSALRAAAPSSAVLTLAALVTLITAPLLMLTGWHVARSRLATCTGGLEPLAGARRQAVDTLPRTMVLLLAFSFVLMTSVKLFNLIYRFSVTDPELRSTQSKARSIVNSITLTFSGDLPLVSIAAVLSAHALRFARRIHAVARRLPQCATTEAVRVLQQEDRLLARHLHSQPMLLLVLSLVLVVVIYACVAAAVLTSGTGARGWVAVVQGAHAFAYAAPAMAALYCVAEVTQGWLAALRALYRLPAEEADAPGSRLLVASEWMAARNEGEVGVRVFGIIVSRGLVVRGLGSVGTLLGLLLRMQAQQGQ